MQNNFEQMAEMLKSQGCELAQLKKRMNRWRTATLAAIAGIAALALIGAVGERAYIPAVIKAHRFVLVGPSGKPAIVLVSSPIGPALIFYGPSGKNTALLVSDSSGASLSFYGPSGKPTALLVSDSSGAELDLYGPSGNPTASLYGGNQNKGFGPNLSVGDLTGFHSVLGVTNLLTPTTGESHQTSAASLVMFNKKGKVIWQAP